MLRFAGRREEATWNEFARISTNLDRWIGQNDPRENPDSILSTNCERELLHQLNDRYDDYLRAARTVHTDR